MTREQIPADVRKTLRTETNFGCPVDGCGSPYLSYHHFDPPYHVKKHNNPEGMIALCLHHHKQADVGTYTNEQLFELKKDPYLKQGDTIEGEFNWRRKDILINAGSNIYCGPQMIYLTKDEPLFWLSTDENSHVVLNLDIKDDSGEIIFSMRENDWIITSDLKNIECIPSGKSLKFINELRSIRLNIEFNNLSKVELLSTFKDRYGQFALNDIANRFKGDQVAICKIQGKLVYPFKIWMKEKETTMSGESGEITLFGSFKVKNSPEIKIAGSYCALDGKSIIDSFPSITALKDKIIKKHEKIKRDFNAWIKPNFHSIKISDNGVFYHSLNGLLYLATTRSFSGLLVIVDDDIELKDEYYTEHEMILFLCKPSLDLVSKFKQIDKSKLVPKGRPLTHIFIDIGDDGTFYNRAIIHWNQKLSELSKLTIKTDDPNIERLFHLGSSKQSSK
ncbi:MAG: hypothetical protein GY710_13760 [Desulfobacteraceae bacterium]|nr:hypothetical protein [Desulfobacteraceae bacterium]